jgi:histidine phosphotransfer protein HptB
MENRSPTVDWTPLQQFWDLMEDDGEAVEDLVQTFLADAPTNLKKLRDCFLANDIPQMGIVAHTLKGSSATMGALHLADLCKTIEEATKENESIGFKATLALIESEYQVVVITLNDWRNYLQEPEV